MKFIGLDGDSIGRHVESLLIEENLHDLTKFSDKIKSSLEKIEQLVLSEGGKIVFSGGDSILFYGEFDVDFANSVLGIFRDETGRTASIGIGNTLLQAYLGLKIAKSKGGNRTFDYSQIKKKNKSNVETK